MLKNLKNDGLKESGIKELRKLAYSCEYDYCDDSNIAILRFDSVPNRYFSISIWGEADDPAPNSLDFYFKRGEKIILQTIQYDNLQDYFDEEGGVFDEIIHQRPGKITLL